MAEVTRKRKMLSFSIGHRKKEGVQTNLIMVQKSSPEAGRGQSAWQSRQNRQAVNPEKDQHNPKQ